ncbi:MAG: hypothetical protein JWO15_965 [Sphingomonadales bacterium]|nr:hypothetical protein [Sphingomonadales bacterium]
MAWEAKTSAWIAVAICDDRLQPESVAKGFAAETASIVEPGSGFAATTGCATVGGFGIDLGGEAAGFVSETTTRLELAAPSTLVFA